MAKAWQVVLAVLALTVVVASNVAVERQRARWCREGWAR
jgi:hypothetical protein